MVPFLTPCLCSCHGNPSILRLGTGKEPESDHERPAGALSCPNPRQGVHRGFVLQPANPHVVPLAFLLLGCLWAQLALGSGWKAGAV